MPSRLPASEFPAQQFGCRAHAQWYRDTQKAIQRLEAWKVSDWAEYPDLDYNELTLAGMWRWRFCRSNKHEITLFHRNIETGAWREGFERNHYPPTLSLAGQANRPSGQYAQPTMMQSWNRIMLHTQSRCRLVPRSPDGWRNAPVLRAALFSSLKKRMAAGHLRHGWLCFTKHMWSQVDRDALSLMLSMRWRQNFSFSQYRALLSDLPHLKSIASVSRNLLPWFGGFSIDARAQVASAVLAGHTQLPPRYFDYATSCGELEGFDLAPKLKVKTKVDPLPWQDLLEVPFSLAHATTRMEEDKQSAFLKSWHQLPAALRARSGWMAGSLSCNHAIPASWYLWISPQSTWPALMTLILTIADQQRRAQGYPVVRTRAWRAQFWQQMNEIQQYWRTDLLNDPRLARQDLSAFDFLGLLPAGCPAQAWLLSMALEAKIPSASATMSPSKSTRL
jgi:hypothetical protein